MFTKCSTIFSLWIKYLFLHSRKLNHRYVLSANQKMKFLRISFKSTENLPFHGASFRCLLVLIFVLVLVLILLLLCSPNISAWWLKHKLLLNHILLIFKLLMQSYRTVIRIIILCSKKIKSTRKVLILIKLFVHMLCLFIFLFLYLPIFYLFIYFSFLSMIFISIILTSTIIVILYSEKGHLPFRFAETMKLFIFCMGCYYAFLNLNKVCFALTEINE